MDKILIGVYKLDPFGFKNTISISLVGHYCAFPSGSTKLFFVSAVIIVSLIGICHLNQENLSCPIMYNMYMNTERVLQNKHKKLPHRQVSKFCKDSALFKCQSLSIMEHVFSVPPAEWITISKKESIGFLWMSLLFPIVWNNKIAKDHLGQNAESAERHGWENIWIHHNSCRHVFLRFCRPNLDPKKLTAINKPLSSKTLGEHQLNRSKKSWLFNFSHISNRHTVTINSQLGEEKTHTKNSFSWELRERGQQRKVSSAISIVHWVSVFNKYSTYAKCIFLVANNIAFHDCGSVGRLIILKSKHCLFQSSSPLSNLKVYLWKALNHKLPITLCVGERIGPC